MPEKTAKLLEFDKILEMLSACCVSEPGKAAARRIEPRPDLTGVAFLQDETQAAETCLLALDTYPVIAFADAGDAVGRSRVGAALSMRELLDVAGVLRAARLLKHALLDAELEGIDVLRRQAANLYEDMTLEKRIHACILSAEEMADSASPRLYDIRRSIRRENARVREKLGEIVQSAKCQKYLQDAIITLRGGRYVVPVRQEYRSMVPGLLHDHSASGQTLFIEPMAVVEINNAIRQLQAEEQAEMERILEELTAEVSPASHELLNDIDILVHLDVVFARAVLSKKMRGVRPETDQSGAILLRGARHPLIPDGQVVPIDVELESGQFGLIITGPNTGGKTVTLKTVGLFVLMAQAGLHISAEYGARLPVYDSVFSDIGDEQSIELSLSTFSSHIMNVIGILENITGRSLVLMDEMGAGTDPAEGAALAMAILDALREKNATVLATTHYSELKAFAMEREGLVNASMEFDMETLRPTYRVLMGVPGSSNALEISRKLGLSEEVVRRARAYMAREKVDYEALLSEAQDHLNKAQREREEARRDRDEAAALLERVRAEEEKLAEKREDVLTRARAQAREIVQGAQAETERVIKELRRAAADAQTAALEREIQKARGDLRAQAEAVGDLAQRCQGALSAPEGLMPGETVELIGHNLKATVLSPPDNKGELQVQAGVMKLNVHVSNVRRGKASAPQSAPAPRAPGKGLAVRSVASELDVRGQTVEEASLHVDKYLDDVAQTGLREVFIIHGKGTGALRAGLHKNLRNHPHVKSFRLGNYGEGDAGVTVVELQ